MPANAQVPDWSGLYLGIHAGVTDGIKATPWASSEVEEKRRFPGTPPEYTPGYCEGPRGTTIGALDSEEACENPNRQWQESGGGCYAGDQPFGNYGSQEECEAASNQPAVEYTWNTNGFCYNANGQTITGNSQATCSGGPNVWIPAGCVGPGNTYFPALSTEGSCTAAGSPGTPELTWVPGSSACVDTQTQLTIPGLTSQGECEGQYAWQDPVYSPGTPGLNKKLSAFDFVTGAASQAESFMAGAQAGYNWQRGRFVFGIEGDVSGFTDNTDRVNASSIADLSGVYGLGTRMETEVTGSARMEWWSTLRGRLGVVVKDDFLPYVTGGLAVGRASIDGSIRFSGQYGLGGMTESFGSTVSLDRSKTLTGYTIGGGLDYRMTDRMFLNFTYLHVDLGKMSSSASFSGSRSDGSGNHSSVSGKGGIDVDAKFNIFRLGVNVRF